MFRPFSAYAAHHSYRGHGATLRPVLQVLTAVFCLSAAAACGGDDSDAPAETAGSGGSGGKAGSGGAGGATTPPPPMPVACGSTMCYPPTNPLSGILNMFGGGALAGAIPMAQACCLDESAGTCGVNPGMGSSACEALATVDTRCPKANLGMLGGFVNIQPCCIENQCGQDGKLFGRGCVQNSEVASMLGPLAAGGMIMLPSGVACDAPPTPTKTDHEDAGVHDTDAGM